MGTEKFRAIYNLVKADHVMLLTQKGNSGIARDGYGKADLDTMMMMAVELQVAANDMMKAIEDVATAQGELHTLMALKETMDKITPEAK